MQFIDLKTVENTDGVSRNSDGKEGGDNVYANTIVSQESVSSVYEILRAETRNTQRASNEQLTPWKNALYWCKQNVVHLVLGIHSAVLLSVVVIVGVSRASVTDGKWSSWAQWEQCSTTCDVGLRNRFRTCTNPEPAAGGKHCMGDSFENQLCKNRSCPDWSSWGSWSQGSLSCDIGMQHRFRSCTNFEASDADTHCLGESSENRVCRVVPCPATYLFSAFSVSTPSKCATYRTTAAKRYYNSCNFTNVLYQYGTDFNFSTGAFNCSIPGTYLFSVNLVKIDSSSTGNYVDCYLLKYTNNGFIFSQERLAYLYLQPGSTDLNIGLATMSSAVVEFLELGDLVALYCYQDPASTLGRWSSFTGVLLYPNVSDMGL